MSIEQAVQNFPSSITSFLWLAVFLIAMKRTVRPFGGLFSVNCYDILLILGKLQRSASDLTAHNNVTY